jgi:hypothetical protein
MIDTSKDNLILSTAAFCLWDIPIQEKLENCHQLGFRKVQIALSTIKMLENFTASLKHIPQINNFKDVSIHAPWCGIKYGRNKSSFEILDYLKHIDKYLPISRYVFNYDCILDAEILYKSGLKIMIRNPVKPDSWNRYKAEIYEKSIPAVFDLNKAARNNYPINSMIEEIRDSVSEIHVSGFIDGKNRMPVVSSKQEYLLNYLAQFNTGEIPIIIEGLFSPKNFPSIIAEKNLINKHCI